MIVVSEFRIESETQYFEMCIYVYYSVVDLQIESNVIFYKLRSEEFISRLCVFGRRLVCLKSVDEKRLLVGRHFISLK